MKLQERLKKAGINAMQVATLLNVPHDRVYKWVYNDIQLKSDDYNKLEELFIKIKGKSQEEIKLMVKQVKLNKQLQELNNGNLAEQKAIGEPVKQRIFTNIKPVDDGNFMEVPYISAMAQAGYLNSLENELPDSLDTMLVPKEYEKGNYLVIEVIGDSMNDGTIRSIIEGDKILVKMLDPVYYKQDRINTKRNLYVIVHKDGIVLKEITEHDLKSNTITLHSWNSYYADYTISINDVQQIFYYKKLVERRPIF